MKRSRERRRSNWAARILAALALVAVSLVVIVVISGSVDSGDDDGGSANGRPSSASRCHPDADQAVSDGYYVVDAADVQGLSGIAEKTCVAVDRLIRLNPNLDPQLLQVSNCVDLVPDGCRKLSGS